jgi:hypothetical protein
MEFHTYPEETETEIEELGHTVTNVWNIKHYRTKLNVPCRTYPE